MDLKYCWEKALKKCRLFNSTKAPVKEEHICSYYCKSLIKFASFTQSQCLACSSYCTDILWQVLFMFACHHANLLANNMGAYQQGMHEIASYILYAWEAMDWEHPWHKRRQILILWWKPFCCKLHPHLIGHLCSGMAEMLPLPMSMIHGRSFGTFIGASGGTGDCHSGMHLAGSLHPSLGNAWCGSALVAASTMTSMMGQKLLTCEGALQILNLHALSVSSSSPLEVNMIHHCINWYNNCKYHHNWVLPNGSVIKLVGCALCSHFSHGQFTVHCGSHGIGTLFVVGGKEKQNINQLVQHVSKQQ